MKLVYLHQYFVFPDGSGGTRSYDLASQFARNGYEIEFITTSAFIRDDRLKDGWNLIVRDGLTLHILKLDYGNEMSFFSRIGVFIKFLWLATFKLLSIRCDLVLATSTPLTIGIPALIKLLIHRTPFLFEVRDVWPEAVIAIGAIKNKIIIFCLNFLEWLIYKYASAIVPLSTDMKASIERRYPNLAEKSIVVIENISEIKRFQLIKENHRLSKIVETSLKARFSILYAGTFGFVNGLDYVIKLAAETIKIDDSIIYILVGAGAEKEKIVSFGKHLGVIDKNVFIFDPVTKDDLPLLYRSVNMGSSFVINVRELWANSANKFFDTLAAGKPILINHGGWQKTTIDSRKIGFALPALLDKKSVEDFVDYTSNDELIELQEGLALETAKVNYSLEVATTKYLGLFNNVLKNVQ